jgi:hypothetical protein
MSKKDKKKLPQEVYGKNYLIKNGRNLPIVKCLISEDAGLVSNVIVRRLPNGNYAVGSYLIDRWCLGLKSTMYRIDISLDDYEEFIDMIGATLSNLQECTYATIHNWIYGGIAYAEELGFGYDNDFRISKF